MKKLNGASPLAIGRHYRFSQHSSRAHAAGDPTNRTRNLIYCLCATSLSCVVCISLQLVALSGSYWAYYTFQENGNTVETGNFGLWQICVNGILQMDVTDCEPDQPGRRLVLPAWCAIAGICGGLSVGLQIGCLVVALLQLFRIGKGEQVFCANRRALSHKIAPAMFSLIAATACLIFSALAMRRIRSAQVTFASSFWIEVSGICFTVIVLICTAVESFWRPYPTHGHNKEAPMESTVESEPGKPKLQSFFPRESSRRETVKLIPQKTDVLMDPRAARKDPPEPVAGERFADMVKAAYRRSNSEGATKSSRIS